MSKDEVSRQLEEMKKYLEEQEKAGNADAAGDDVPLEENYKLSGYDNEYIPEDEEIEEVFDAEPVAHHGASADSAGTKQNNAGCGCSGCLTAIILFVLASMLLSIFSTLV